MSTETAQGNLSQLSVTALLQKIVLHQLEGVLQLRFENQALNTKMIVAGQSLGGMLSPFVPQWSKMLVPKVMSSEMYERIRLQHSDASTALQVLIKEGVLPITALENLLAARAKMGLMPILERTDGQFVFTPRPVYQEFLQPGVKISPLLEQLQFRKLPTFEPTNTYLVIEGVIGKNPNLETLDYEVIAALANELTLLEVAQRSQLAWDELGVIIQKLESLGMIRLRPFVPPTKIPRIRQRLIPGDLAPDFELPGLGGTKVRLSDYRGKKVLLRFNRQAGCPICNPRNREFIRMYDTFKNANVELIGIFGSPEDVLPLGIGKQQPPYPVLADPKDIIYAKYGVERSLWGMLSPQNWKNMNKIIEGTKMETFRTAAEGEATRMPAEFFINEQGYIEQVHYHAFATDFLPLDTLLTDWLNLKT